GEGELARPEPVCREGEAREPDEERLPRGGDAPGVEGDRCRPPAADRNSPRVNPRAHIRKLPPVGLGESPSRNLQDEDGSCCGDRPRRGWNVDARAPARASPRRPGGAARTPSLRA